MNHHQYPNRDAFMRLRQAFNHPAWRYFIYAFHFLNLTAFVCLFLSDCLHRLPLNSEANHSLICTVLANTSLLLSFLFASLGILAFSVPGEKQRLVQHQLYWFRLIQVVGRSIMYGIWGIWGGLSLLSSPQTRLGFTALGFVAFQWVAWIIARGADTRLRLHST